MTRALEDPSARTPDPLRRSAVAIYLQLSSLFRSRIVSGVWPVGARIPNVDELAAEFDVARGTIRQALDVLAAEGLIERQRAKGTFVRRDPGSSQVHLLEMNWSSITSAHVGSVITPLENALVDSLPPHLAGDAPPVPAYRRMRRFHARDGMPYLLGTSYLDERLYQALPPARFESEPLLVLLQEAAGARLGRARQVLTIGAADVETAGRLDIAINSPIAIMRRQVLSTDGALIYASEGLYKGDAVRLEIELR